MTAEIHGLILSWYRYAVPRESQEVFGVEMGPENWVRVHDCLVIMRFPPIRAIF
jgi:hypothetical protein